MSLQSTILWISLSILGPSAITAVGQIAPSNDHGDPYLPVGNLQVTPHVVRNGVQPRMKWGIDYPQSIADLFLISPSGSLLATGSNDDTLEIRLAGASYHAEGEELPVALWVRMGGRRSSWDLVFNGTGSDIDPTETVFSEKARKGTAIDFAARGKTSTGQWYSVQWTVHNTPNVAALIDGDPVPAQSPAIATGQSASFMNQFVSEDSTVELGPREVLYLFELDSGDAGSAGFDMQDLAVVVTSKTKEKNNNGHGNNVDGVDVSNPGQGGGGPNGKDDLSGDVDDEKWIDDSGKILKKNKKK